MFVVLKFIKQKKQLTADLVSVECAEGKYRSSSMTECESCSLGKEPNDAKNDCGKYSFKIFVTCILIFKFFRPNFTNRA